MYHCVQLTPFDGKKADISRLQQKSKFVSNLNFSKHSEITSLDLLEAKENWREIRMLGIVNVHSFPQ